MDMSYNPFSLSGKIILVTGAASGIGRATAIECSKMGASMIITDISGNLAFAGKGRWRAPDDYL